MKVDEYNESLMVAVKIYRKQWITIKKCYKHYCNRYYYDMTLTIKEKEEYVLKLREEGKTYRDIAHELLISPREISRILKEANGEKEAKERKKIVLSNTAKAL